MRFRPLPDREDSELNEGWRYAVTVGAAILLFVLSVFMLMLILGMIS